MKKGRSLICGQDFLKDFSNRTHLGATLARARRDFNHGLCGNPLPYRSVFHAELCSVNEVDRVSSGNGRHE